jgi:hypothetical protein
MGILPGIFDRDTLMDLTILQFIVATRPRVQESCSCVSQTLVDVVSCKPKGKKQHPEKTVETLTSPMKKRQFEQPLKLLERLDSFAGAGENAENAEKVESELVIVLELVYQVKMACRENQPSCSAAGTTVQR